MSTQIRTLKDNEGNVFYPLTTSEAVVNGLIADVTDITGNEYATLGDALTALPESYRKGGMEVRYVNSSDGKYMQYRYTGTSVSGASSTFFDTTYWTQGGMFASGESVDEIGIDEVPTSGSTNLVESGGVFKYIADNTGSFDISAYNSGTTYSGITQALSAVPTEFRKGGMSVRFVQSVDNKYVQYRLMSDTFNTTVANWQGIDAKPIDRSKNLAESGGTKREIDKNSYILSFVGANNTLVNGLPCAGFIGGHIYRFYVVDRNWDMTGITSSSSSIKLNIEASYGSSYAKIHPYDVTIAMTLSEYYDWLCPSSVDGSDTPQWYVRIAGRATEGVEVRVIAYDVTNEILSVKRSRISSYRVTGINPFLRDNFKFNLKKGKTYKASIDATAATQSGNLMTFEIRDCNDTVVVSAGNITNASVKEVRFTASADFYGCWIRAYLSSGAVNVAIIYSIEDISESYLATSISQNNDAEGVVTINTKNTDTNLNNPERVFGHLWFDGNANTFVNGNICYGIVGGKKYRIYIENQDVDMTGVKSGYRLTIDAYKKDDSVQVNYCFIDYNSSLPSYFDVIAPENTVAFRIGGRCAVGARLRCWVEYLTSNEITITQTSDTGTTTFNQNGSELTLVSQTPTRDAPIFNIASSNGVYNILNTLDIRYFELVQGSIYSGIKVASPKYIRTNIGAPLYGGNYLTIKQTKTRSDGGKWQFRWYHYKEDGTVAYSSNNWTDAGSRQDYHYWPDAMNAAYILVCFRLMIPNPENEGQYIETTATPDSVGVGELTIETNNKAFVSIIDKLRSTDNDILNNTLKKSGNTLTDTEKIDVVNSLGLGGTLEKTFTISSGSHSSANDRINVDIKNGHTFNVGLYSDGGVLAATQVFLYDKDGTSYGLEGVSLNNMSTYTSPCDAVSVGVYCASGTTGTFRFVVSAGVQYDLDNYVAPTIENLNKDAVEFVRTTQTKIDSYGNNGFGKYISLLQMTDTHYDKECIKRCLEFGKSNLISLILHTGDLVESCQQDIRAFYKESVLSSSKPVLSIPGNHEFSLNIAYQYTDEYIHDWLYDAEQKTHNGEIHAVIDSVEKNYFYRDITKNGFTMRIIALYPFEWYSPIDGQGQYIYTGNSGKGNHMFTQEQINWFVQLLKDTPSSYGVVIISHYILSASKFTNSDFNEPEKRNTEAPLDIMRWTTNKHFFYDIIKAWVDGGICQTTTTQTTPDEVDHIISVDTTFNGGGKFIANICGHKHSGGMLKMEDENGDASNFRVVLSPCSTVQDVQNTGWWGRSTAAGSKLYDCLNVITYNNDTDKVKIVRVGSTITNELKECKAFVF